MSTIELKPLSCHGFREESQKTCRRYYESFMMVFRRSSFSLCLRLPPLTGLFCLTKLDLGDCNLLDGAIPSDIGLLSSLKTLILTGNNFVTLPESFNQLSELTTLRLNKCQKLKLLPQLPSKIVFVRAEDCTSLETIPSTLFQQCTSPSIRLLLFNCFKLFENHESKNTLADIYCSCWLQKFCYDSSQFCICLGSEISKWFTYWRTDNSIKIQLPSDWLNDDFVGFAICAVVQPLERDWSIMPLLRRCGLEIGPFSFFINFGSLSVRLVKSDHLCFGFLSYKRIKEDMRRKYKADLKVFLDDKFQNLSTDSQYVGRQAKLVFGTEGNDKNKHMKKCGIRPVYKQEVNSLPVPECSIMEQSH